MSTAKQLVVMVENRVGRLAEVTGIIGEAGSNILGFSIAEGENFGIVRFMLDDLGSAYRLLKERGHTVSCTDVLAIPMEDRPGGLHEVSSRCGELGVNIVYAYAFRIGEGAVLVMKVDDLQKSLRALKGAGFTTLSNDDLS